MDSMAAAPLCHIEEKTKELFCINYDNSLENAIFAMVLDVIIIGTTDTPILMTTPHEGEAVSTKSYTTENCTCTCET